MSTEPEAPRCCAVHGTALTCLTKPDDLSEAGSLAYERLRKFLKDEGREYTGGCKVFFNPKVWEARGELYCQKAELIAVYDGGSHRGAFTLDGYEYGLNERMQKALRELGMFFEEGSSWYGGVYKR